MASRFPRFLNALAHRRPSLLTIAAVVVAMLAVLGPGVAQWLWLAAALAATFGVLWAARRPGLLRWLVLVAALLLIWPLIEIRIGNELGGVDVLAGLRVSLALGLLLALARYWLSERGNPQLAWGSILLLACVPLIWSSVAVVYDWTRSAVTPQDLGLSRYEWGSWFVVLRMLLVSIYWWLTAAVIANASRRATPGSLTSPTRA